MVLTNAPAYEPAPHNLSPSIVAALAFTYLSKHEGSAWSAWHETSLSPLLPCWNTCLYLLDAVLVLELSQAVGFSTCLSVTFLLEAGSAPSPSGEDMLNMPSGGRRRVSFKWGFFLSHCRVHFSTWTYKNCSPFRDDQENLSIPGWDFGGSYQIIPLFQFNSQCPRHFFVAGIEGQLHTGSL